VNLVQAGGTNSCECLFAVAKDNGFMCLLVFVFVLFKHRDLYDVKAKLWNAR
jgi:hypothetical protein